VREGKKMKTLVELQEEYKEEEESFKMLEQEHRERVARIKADVMSYAKYATGDRVWHLARNYDGETRWRECGIVRAISAGKEFCGKDEIVPLYTVGKVTKSGAIHATQNLGYSGIPEEDIEPREEV